jgi:hypothetical protein
VQAAVNAAEPGDVIKVAQGTYTDIHVRDGVTQVVYISKTVTVLGGYTTTNWTTPNPLGQVTTLDAQGQGRVLVVSDTSGVTLEGLAITGGDATDLKGSGPDLSAGGGLYAIHAPSLTVSGCDIYSNSARTKGQCCGHGGGLHLFLSDNARVEESTIRDNWGNRDGIGKGGGLYLEYCDRAVLRGNSIAGNTGDSANGRGGGLYARRCDDALIDSNVFSGNVATPDADGRGGGAYLSSCNRMKLTASTFRDNVGSGCCWGYGGAIGIEGGSQVVLDSNVIVGNATSNHPSSTGFAGGGLFLDNADVTIVNTVVADNTAGARGSAVYASDSSPRFLHSTIARNTGGDGSAIYVTDEYGAASRVAFTNTIIFSHTVGITVTAGHTATLDGTLWYANGTNTGGAGTIDIGAVNVYGDPAFSADGYHLTSESAAIDAGVDSRLSSDIDGDPRPSGTGFDVGADEVFRGHIFLPIVLRAW